MKVVKSKHFPFKGFAAINLFGILFVRKEFYPLEDRTMTHEKIHSRQLIELCYIGFYLWYIIEWIIRLIQYRNIDDAYKNISLEREAYTNEVNNTYLDNRKKFSFITYIK